MVWFGDTAISARPLTNSSTSSMDNGYPQKLLLTDYNTCDSPIFLSGTERSSFSALVESSMVDNIQAVMPPILLQ